MDRSAAQVLAGLDRGGFYRNMRYVLEYALAEGYDFCFFFEDDMQFVWLKEDYPGYIRHVFSVCPEAIQIQPLFFRRFWCFGRNLESDDSEIEYIQPAKAYRSSRGFNTTAIWNLNAVRKNPDFRLVCYEEGDPDYSPSYLAANSCYWLNKGNRLYLQFDPTVAHIPWLRENGSSATSHSESFENSGNKGQKFLLNPLTREEIGFLRNRSPSVSPYQELFGLSPENMARPFWDQQGDNLGIYYMLCRRVVDEENRIGQSPISLPIRENLNVAKSNMFKSHLGWKPLIESTDSKPWKSMLKRYVPASLHPVVWHARLSKLKRLNPRNYLGYFVLRRRLSREQESLPFVATAEIDRKLD